MKETYTLKELESMPTLAVGQADDLKAESNNKRVWLSRMTLEDGQPYNNQVSIEVLIEGVWQVVKQYEAK